MSSPLTEKNVVCLCLFPGDARTRVQLVCAVAFVVLADWLFYGHKVGWTLGAFGCLLGVGAILLGAERMRSRAAGWLGACFGVLCLRAVVDPEPRVVFLGCLVGIGLLATVRDGWTWSGITWRDRWLRFVWQLCKSYGVAATVIVVAPFFPVYALLHVKRVQRWIVPVVVGCVFLGLFAYANPVIALGVSSVWKALANALTMPTFGSVARCLLWVTVGAIAWASIRYRAGGAASDVSASIQDGVPMCDQLLKPDVIRNALVLFNALFALQTALDFWYLWGGGTLPQGVTYAEYAQRGAYPLVVTALLAALFVLVTFREGSASAENRAMRLLVYGWLAQNVLLVVSAGWRLWLYVSVYSLSRLRLAAGVWMVLVMCGLVWIFVRILVRQSNEWLVKVNLISLAVVLIVYACGFPNMLVAGFNVRHCREAGKPDAHPVDLAYLHSLGYDALPALMMLECHVKDTPLAPSVRSCIWKLRMRLTDSQHDWRGATFKRQYLAKKITGRVDDFDAPSMK